MRVPRHRFGVYLAVVASVGLANPAFTAIAVAPQGEYWEDDLRRMFSPKVYTFLEGEKISVTVHDVTLEDPIRTISRRFVFTGPCFKVVGDGERRIEDFTLTQGNILGGLMYLLVQYPGAFIESKDAGRGMIILRIPPRPPDA